MTIDDLMAVARSTDRYNFHSHTEFCDGRATVAEFARRAAADGFLHYGFSPHSPIPFESPCNMSADDVGRFFNEVDKASETYGDSTRFYKAMEIDFINDDWGPSNDYFKSLPLDYAIGSVHFIPGPEGYVDIDGSFANFKVKMERFFAGDIRHVVEAFYSQSRRMLELGGFQIIGHFDKIGHNAAHFRDGIEDEAWYRRLVDDLIDLIAEKGVIAEINTKALEGHGRVFPGERYMRRLAEAGIPVVVDSDAHYPDLIDASRAEAFAMMSKAGLLQ